MKADGESLFKFCFMSCNHNKEDKRPHEPEYCVKDYIKELTEPYVFGVDLYHCRMPCHGKCLVTVINEVGIRPYGEFYYELVSTGYN